MEDKLVSNKEYDEIEISKYGKKKIKTNKRIFSNRFLGTIFMMIISTSLILILFIHINPKIITNNSQKESQPKYKTGLEKNSLIFDKDKLNEKALKMKLKIYPLPQYFLHRTDYALLNIFKLVKLNKEDIDINRFILALNKTIYNHPVLLSRFHKEDDGEIYIDYRPDLPPEI